jgi:hypothetical protein
MYVIIYFFSVCILLVPFSISRHTGVITLASTLDYEIVNSYKFVVLVSDAGHPPQTATVDVQVNVADVNDNAPSFTQSGYNGDIAEDDTAPQSRQLVHMVGCDT